MRHALPEDDPALRHLLAEGAMDGPIRLAMEREPSFSGSLGLEGVRHDTVVLDPGSPAPGGVARGEGAGGGAGEGVRLRGMGTRVVLPVTLRGEPALLGYLSHLRAAPGQRVTPRRMREGWRLLLGARRPDELPFDLTSIPEGNEPARRLLERGVPGFPRYHRVGRYRVQAIPTTPRGRGVPGVEVVTARAEGPPGEASGIPSLRRVDRGAALAARWEFGERQAPGDASFRLEAREEGRPVGGVVIVDPSSWRQYRIRGYAGAVGRLRPLLNVLLGLRGAPRLPPAGSALRPGFVCGLWTLPDRGEVAEALAREAARTGAARGLTLLLAGGMEDDPHIDAFTARYRPQRYHSTLYLVDGDDPGPVLEELRRGPLRLDPVLL